MSNLEILICELTADNYGEWFATVVEEYFTPTEDRVHQTPSKRLDEMLYFSQGVKYRSHTAMMVRAEIERQREAGRVPAKRVPRGRQTEPQPYVADGILARREARRTAQRMQPVKA